MSVEEPRTRPTGPRGGSVVDLALELSLAAGGLLLLARILLRGLWPYSLVGPPLPGPRTGSLRPDTVSGWSEGLNEIRLRPEWVLSRRDAWETGQPAHGAWRLEEVLLEPAGP